MKELQGRVAVVTGAGSGMGLAFATRFAAEGMKVVLADIETAALDGALSELRAAGHDVYGVRTDVSSLESIQQLAGAAVDTYGKVHLVCNNAGVEGYLGGAIWEATEKDWQWTLGTNLMSVIYGLRTFVPLLLSHGEEGHVVNTCSMTAVVRAGNMYGVAKHAILALSEVLYGDLVAAGAPIGVTALCPGIVATRLFQGSRNRPAALRNEGQTVDQTKGTEVRERMHAVLSGGMPPSEVADQLVAAIRAGQLYLLTDHDWDDRIRERNANILAGTNPAVRGAP